MPETASSAKPEVHHPATVGSTFMRQYYHLLAKEPASLHRFYKDESTWCHGVGSHMQDSIQGQKNINDEILRRGYAGARVDLDIGSIDCQPSLHGGVLVLVTGVMTLASSPLPKPFVQTFVLAVQPKGYFVLNDCLRFLELPAAASAVAPSAADAAVAPKDAKKPAQAAIGTPVAASPAAKKDKPATPVAAAKKDTEKAKPASPVKATPVSPVKAKSPAKVASPKAAPAATATASPVKKAAPADAKVTLKPSETKPATPASPAAKPAPATPAAPATPVVAPTKLAEPAAPPAPKTWAALFSGAPAAPVTAPKLAAVAATAVAAAKPTPASPAKATPTDAPAEAAPAAAAAPQEKEKEKKRLYSLYIRDVPSQTKESDLRELFKAYGTIASVGVPAGRGIAFVDYREEESMRAALADDKEFKVHDKVLHVEERKDKEQRSGFRADSRGGRGGRGAPKSGRSGDRKEREDGKERRPVDREAGGNANGKAAANGPRAPNTGDRREKGGRRSGKEDGGRGNSARAE